MKCFEKSESFQSVSARNFPFPRFWADCAEFIIPYRSEHRLSEILALENELEKKYLISESLASSVMYLYLKNFKALRVILNHFIEAHISDKAFSPRFLSKVNKMKRKVTYSYEERNQSRIRESYRSGKSYLSWHKGYFDVSSLFQDLMFLRFQLLLSIIRFQMQLKLLTSARTIFV